MLNLFGDEFADSQIKVDMACRGHHRRTRSVGTDP